MLGSAVSVREEVNGYVFWGGIAVFIAVSELLAAFSKTLKAKIPWPTISNLVGRDLERNHHWIALVMVGLIVMVIVHTLTHSADQKKAGRAMRRPAEEAIHWHWGGRYIILVAAAAIVAGLVASALGAGKDALGYVIYLTLTALGVVVPSLLAYGLHRVLEIPTLFGTIALLRLRAHWVAAFVVALLVVLLFHLALYPWPNYPFGKSG